MITYLPEIYPDELVYSWFCRFYSHSACLSHKEALSELYCKRSDNPSKEFIGNLNSEAKQRIESMYSMEELILQHTMFPQYARFVPLKQKIDALYKLIHDSVDVHHLFCVLPRGTGEQYLKYCPVCVEEDREKYGETYWHRRHQIRNMNICTKHKCKLIESVVTAKSENTFVFCPAENYVDIDTPTFIDDVQAIQYAGFVEQIFGVEMDFKINISISSILYHGMKKTDYMKTSGRSRYTKKFVEDMTQFYKGIGMQNTSSIYQVQRTLLGDGFDFSVVCQIAFFLDMNVSELINPELTGKEIEQEKNSHYVKGKVPINWDVLDEETEPLLEAVAYDVYNGVTSGRPERVSEKMLYRELNLQGHRLEKMPRSKAVYDKYKETYPESWARKIIWAYNKIKEEKSVLYWSDIRKLSGVNKHNIDAVLPYLPKYADDDIVAEVIEIAKGVSHE